MNLVEVLLSCKQLTDTLVIGQGLSYSKGNMLKLSQEITIQLEVLKGNIETDGTVSGDQTTA